MVPARSTNVQRAPPWWRERAPISAMYGWGPAIPIVRALLLLIALLSPAMAEDGPGLAAGASDAANQLQTYLDGVAKAGGRPDYSKPPAADLLARIIDLRALAAQPPPTAQDLVWLTAWSGAAARTLKSIIYFGVTFPPGPADAKVMERNMADSEDLETALTELLIRITARQVQATDLLMKELPPEELTPMRQEGFNTARVGAAKLLDGALTMLMSALKPENERRISAALNDTRDIWAGDVPAKDRPQLVQEIAEAGRDVTDAEAHKNLAALGAALAAVQ